MTVQIFRALCTRCGVRVRVSATGQYDHHRRTVGGRLTRVCENSGRDVPAGIEQELGPCQPIDHVTDLPEGVAGRNAAGYALPGDDVLPGVTR